MAVDDNNDDAEDSAEDDADADADAELACMSHCASPSHRAITLINITMTRRQSPCASVGAHLNCLGRITLKK